VLFAELIPCGSEVEWFGMQAILSCGTVSGASPFWTQRGTKHASVTDEEPFSTYQVWANYVASGPLQNATHQLRFPLVISLIFLTISVLVEVCRRTLKVFATDSQRWKIVNDGTPEGVTRSATPALDTTEGLTIATK
jgi:hypothetical protein